MALNCPGSLYLQEQVASLAAAENSLNSDALCLQSAVLHSLLLSSHCCLEENDLLLGLKEAASISKISVNYINDCTAQVTSKRKTKFVSKDIRMDIGADKAPEDKACCRLSPYFPLRPYLL